MSAHDLAERLDAVERALTDEETDLTELRDAAALTEDVTDLEERVAELEAAVEELDAAVEAVRGYAGNVRAVNREVERRASAALAKAEALESAVGSGSGDGDLRPPGVEYSTVPNTAELEETVAAGTPTVGREKPRVGEDGRPGTDPESRTVSPENGAPESSGGRRGAGDTGRVVRQTGPDTGLDGQDEHGQSRSRDGTDRGRDSHNTAAGRGDTRPGGQSQRRQAGQRRTDSDGTRNREDWDQAATDGAGEDEDDDGGTEQFIERVREAL